MTSLIRECKQQFVAARQEAATAKQPA